MSSEPTSKRSLVRRAVGVGALLVSGLLVVSILRASALNEKKRRAQAGCVMLYKAVSAYSISSRSPGTADEEIWPRSLSDLVSTPATSFLLNGLDDLIDPWGQQYRYESTPQPNGERTVLVSTTAPDGTLISQHGIGREALH